MKAIYNLRIKSIKLFLIVLISLTWFTLNIQKFFLTFSRSNQLKEFRQNILINNYLNLSLFFKFNGEIPESKKFLKEAVLLLNKEEAINNNIFYIKRSIIYFNLNDDQEALEDLARVNSKKYAPTAELVKGIFTEKSPAESTENIVLALEENLKGYYLYKTKVRLYKIKGETKKAAELEIKEKNHIQLYFIKTLAFVLTFILLIICGFALIIIFSVRGMLKLKKPWTSPELNADRAWMGFIFWDVLHLTLPPLLVTLGIRLTMAGPLVLFYISISMIALVVAFKAIGIKDFGDIGKLGIKFSGFPKSIWAALAGYPAALFIVFASAMLNSIIFKNINISSNPIFEVIEKISGTSNIIYIFLLVTIIGPFFEELIFRGLLYTSFRQTFGAPLSILIVSFVFSFIHGDLPGLLPIFSLSIIITYLYEETGSILASFILHALWNAGTFFAFMALINAGG